MFESKVLVTHLKYACTVRFEKKRGLHHSNKHFTDVSVDN